jgi:AraC-like DNA-binding protein
MDPFLDLIKVLRPAATLWRGADAHGRWGVSFRPRGDLLFCWVERGECQLTRPGLPAVRMQSDDFVLVRASSTFVLTSDPSVKPLDIEALVATTKGKRLQLGSGLKSPVTLHGGRFVINPVNEELLTGLLPPLIHIVANDPSSWRVRSLLKINREESLQPRPGSQFVVARLMEVILVECLRTESLRVNPEQTGLLAGLADPVAARALTAMHGKVASNWTVSVLAKLCGVSRSTFAHRFRVTVGMGPIEYLQRWRMALAKDDLIRGKRSVGEIALAIGFQSSSAFSTAFSRAMGCSPKQFATSKSR